ncbi:hypothetical protein BVC93_01365 [Mycobacterium sp. MS1601]|nr:hypothetical protein BVC93_01365 [Mycobacterium sp. MS1601]
MTHSLVAHLASRIGIDPTMSAQRLRSANLSSRRFRFATAVDNPLPIGAVDVEQGRLCATTFAATRRGALVTLRDDLGGQLVVAPAGRRRRHH